MIGNEEQESVSKERTARGRAARGFQAMLTVVLLIFLSGCPCTEESFCDLSRQISFLPVGVEIVGDWYWVEDVEKASPEFRFSEKGHFVHQKFGCGDHRLATVPGGTNTGRTSAGYECTTLVSHTIEPGRFRMEYGTSGRALWIEGRLLADGKFKLDSNISINLTGTFVKRLPPEKANGPSDVFSMKIRARE